MSLAKPFVIPGSANFDGAIQAQPSPDGNRMPGRVYSEPEWRPGAGQNTVLTKSPTLHYEPVAPVPPPFRLG